MMTPWQVLVLARLFAAGETGATMAQLRSATKPWLRGTRSSEQDAELQAVLAQLQQRGQAEARKQGRTTKWHVTPVGDRAAREALHLPESGPRPAWAKLVVGPLIAVALGVAPKTEAERKLIASAPGLRAAVLRRKHDLALRELPSAKQATDALLWTQLGVESDSPFSMEAVKRHLLAKALGQSAGSISSAKLQAQLASQAAGARRNDLKAMRESLVQTWLGTPALPEPEMPPALPAPGNTLRVFAGHVHEAVRQTVSGWFGDSLVFIHHVYATYGAQFAGEGLSYDDFKARLVDAHRAGLLELARADLVSSMNPIDVAQSETHYLNGTFHFIRMTQGE